MVCKGRRLVAWRFRGAREGMMLDVILSAYAEYRTDKAGGNILKS